MNSLTNRRLAVCGILGGVLYMVSDLFLFLSPNLSGSVPDVAWTGMGARVCAITSYINLTCGLMHAAPILKAWLPVFM